jgi:hypothetical protein
LGTGGSAAAAFLVACGLAAGGSAGGAAARVGGSCVHSSSGAGTADCTRELSDERLEENFNSLRRGDDVFVPRPVTGKAGVLASLSAVVPLTVIKTRVENNELVVITTLKSNETRKNVFESAQTKITKSGNILKLPIAMLFRQGPSSDALLDLYGLEASDYPLPGTGSGAARAAGQGGSANCPPVLDVDIQTLCSKKQRHTREQEHDEWNAASMMYALQAQRGNEHKETATLLAAAEASRAREAEHKAHKEALKSERALEDERSQRHMNAQPAA